MLKKTLIAATALSAVALGAASPASAHYKGHYNFSWYAGYRSQKSLKSRVSRELSGQSAN